MPAGSNSLGSIGLLLSILTACSLGKGAQDGASAVGLSVSELSRSATGIIWREIPSGCFVMGEEQTYSEESPLTEVCVESFAMSRTEVTNAQYAAFVAETGYKTRAERGWEPNEEAGLPEGLPPGSFTFAPNGQVRGLGDWWQFREGAYWRKPDGQAELDKSKAQQPVVHISYEDAVAYARWAEARLPTEAEWEYAARAGNDRQLFAWGEKQDRTVHANTWQGVFPVLNSEEDGYAGPSPVGSFPENAFGLVDMIGNVWEWTASKYYPNHQPGAAVAARENGFDPMQPGRPVRTIKGGSFLCSPDYCLRYRPAARQGQDIDHGTSHIGFRIVQEVKATE